jgi:hypothetical protein
MSPLLIFSLTVTLGGAYLYFNATEEIVRWMSAIVATLFLVFDLFETPWFVLLVILLLIMFASRKSIFNSES